MKQVKFFSVPEEIMQANAFLAVTPPESVATVSKGEQCFVIVNYDDQTYPDAYKAEEIRGLMLSNTKEAMTAKITRDIMTLDLDKFQGDLKKAETELATVEAMEVPMVTVKDGKNKGKKILDYVVQAEKTIKATEWKAKVKSFSEAVKNVEEGIRKIGESLERFEKKNTALQHHLDELNLPTKA